MKCARGQGRSQVGRGRGERGKEDKINIKLDVEEDVLEENKAV